MSTHIFAHSYAISSFLQGNMGMCAACIFDTLLGAVVVAGAKSGKLLWLKALVRSLAPFLVMLLQALNRERQPIRRTRLRARAHTHTHNYTLSLSLFKTHTHKIGKRERGLLEKTSSFPSFPLLVKSEFFLFSVFLVFLSEVVS